MADSVGISMQEFEQLQMQIVTLRTENYDLQSKNGRYAKELYDVKQKLEGLSSENQRLSKIVSRDKGAKEIEKLVKENERLQQQEADFQLQCQTLMGEIQQLSSDKDLLSQSVEQLKSVINASSVSPDEIESMRSELSALREESNRLRTSASGQFFDRESEEGVVDNEKQQNAPVDSIVSNNDSVVLDLKMQVGSMQNERKLLLAQLDECQKQIQTLQSTNNALTATVEDKQRVCEQLSIEKESLSSEILSLRDQCTDLQNFKAKFEMAEADLRRSEIERKETNDTHSSVVAALQADASSWQDKYDHIASDVEQLRSEISRLKEQLEISSASSESAFRDLTLERNRVAELETKLGQQISSLADVERQLAESSRQISMFTTTTEQSEQRLAELQSNIALSNEECSDLRSQLVVKQSEVDRLTDESASLQSLMKSYAQDLEEKKEQAAALQSEMNDMCSQKEADLEELRKEIQMIRQNAQEEILTSRRKDAAKVKDLQRQLKTEKRRVEQLQDRLEQLFQQNSSLSQMESSPHHLSAELSDRKSVDHDFETSSVSSFSFSNVRNALFGSSTGSAALPKTVSSTGAAAYNSTPSHSHTQQLQANNDMVSDLAGQIAHLNLENDRLREKISYLESTSSSMADDLLKKQQLIDHYLMAERPSAGVSPSVSLNAGFSNTGIANRPQKADAPTPVLAFKNLFEKVSSHTNAQAHNSGNSAEETKRLRRAMEEILTKNMNLEADLQRLSEENVWLRTTTAIPLPK